MPPRCPRVGHAVRHNAGHTGCPDTSAAPPWAFSMETGSGEPFYGAQDVPVASIAPIRSNAPRAYGAGPWCQPDRRKAMVPPVLSAKARRPKAARFNDPGQRPAGCENV